MPKVTLLVGLPGSGKSTYLRNRFADAERICDDFFKDSVNDKTGIVKSRCYEMLRKVLKEGQDYAIADVVFCNKDVLDKTMADLRALGHELNVSLEIEPIYFRNDPNACRHNVVHRRAKGDDRNYILALERIDNLSKIYESPANALPVVDCCKEIS